MGENKANAISHLLYVLNSKKETKDQHKKIMHKILWVVEMLKLREKNHIHTHTFILNGKKMQHQQKKRVHNAHLTKVQAVHKFNV